MLAAKGPEVDALRQQVLAIEGNISTLNAANSTTEIASVKERGGIFSGGGGGGGNVNIFRGAAMAFVFQVRKTYAKGSGINFLSRCREH